MSATTRKRLTVFVCVILLATLAGGCRTVEPGDGAAQAYQSNVLHWNALSGGRTWLPFVPPIADPDATLAELDEINELFRLAFYILSETENRSGAGQSSTDEAGGGASSRSIVRVSVTSNENGPDPYVYGLLLTRHGWVVTLQHPFSGENGEMRDAYLSSRDGEGRYPMVYRVATTETNLLLTRFAIPDVSEGMFPPQEGVIPLLNATVPLSDNLPPFGVSAKDTAAWVMMEESRILLTVVETDRVLSLGDDRVYENNIVTNAPMALRTLRSGTPLYAADGAILGLFYQRSLDGMTAGFVSIEDLPRQIGYAIADLVVASTRKELR